MKRIGIIGCGAISRSHINGYKSCGEAEIVAVYDINEDAAKSLASECNAKAAGSIDGLVSDFELDGISVCTPPGMHVENVFPCLEAGVGVLCEKPMAINRNEAEKIKEVVGKTGSVFVPAFCHRFHPPVIELKKIIDNGILGTPVLFRNIFGGYRQIGNNHRSDPKVSGGGALIDNCSHSIDLFRILAGEPTDVFASTGNVMQKMRIEDFCNFTLSCGGNTFGEITSGYSLKCCGAWAEWYGTKGAAIISYWNPGHPELAYKLEGDRGWTAIDSSAHSERFTSQARHFINCLKGEVQLVEVDDGIKCCEIVDCAYESARIGKRVNINL
jgi:predicted dehydrogenase